MANVVSGDLEAGGNSLGFSEWLIKLVSEGSHCIELRGLSARYLLLRVKGNTQVTSSALMGCQGGGDWVWA